MAPPPEPRIRIVSHATVCDHGGSVRAAQLRPGIIVSQTCICGQKRHLQPRKHGQNFKFSSMEENTGIR
eukprot:2216232-Pleurochrysis_carterae.AAC.3